MEQARSFAQILQNQAAMEMQREGEENPEHFLPSGKARHKVTPTFDELLEKLNHARQIQRGEEVVEPPPPQPEVRAGMPVLGQGPEPRKVRPIKSTDEFPNPACIVQNLVNVKCLPGMSKEN